MLELFYKGGTSMYNCLLFIFIIIVGLFFYLISEFKYSKLKYNFIAIMILVISNFWEYIYLYSHFRNRCMILDNELIRFPDYSSEVLRSGLYYWFIYPKFQLVIMSISFLLLIFILFRTKKLINIKSHL